MNQKLLLIGLFNALTALLIIYLLGFSYMSDGFQPMEAALFSVLPGILLLIVSLVSSAYFLYDYQMEKLLSNEKPIHWVYQLLIVTGATIFFSISLDYIVFFIDDSLPKSFSNALLGVFNTNDQIAEESVNQFANWPFFIQNIFVNVFGILVGVLISIPVSRYILRVKVKVN